MTISVRLFAAARDLAGCARTSLDLPDGATVADAWAALGARYAGLAEFGLQGLAVNQEYVDADHVLGNGDELAVIPPVSGG